jgi:hypothetical protein
LLTVSFTSLTFLYTKNDIAAFDGREKSPAVIEIENQGINGFAARGFYG